ncbi:hypothetical protein [Amphritea pacifica]|uniref:hypothetical protein n=1 Tax=Amphritea pacifica TaxID=2811233 RepID=UPI00196543BF|nr:hypothetical protein [Amphritea pacifica]MBN1009182.1 hypothetical protein [Amphritea pacifica]
MDALLFLLFFILVVILNGSFQILRGFGSFNVDDRLALVCRKNSPLFPPEKPSFYEVLLKVIDTEIKQNPLDGIGQLPSLVCGSSSQTVIPANRVFKTGALAWNECLRPMKAKPQSDENVTLPFLEKINTKPAIKSRIMFDSLNSENGVIPEGRIDVLTRC